MLRFQPRQNRHHVSRRHPPLHFQRQTFSRKFVQHRKPLQPSAVHRFVHREIPAPHVVLVLRFFHRATVLAVAPRPFSPLPQRVSQAFLPPQPLHSLLVNLHLEMEQEVIDTPAPVAPVAPVPSSLFLDITLPLIARGIPVTPIRPGTKRAFLPDFPTTASTDPNQIAEWGRVYSDHNAACVARAEDGGVWFLETDSPDVAARVLQNTGHALTEIQTFQVQSRPGRQHYYFHHNARTKTLGNISQTYVLSQDWSVRTNREYVVAPGSIHPDTGQPYSVISDAAITEAPEWLIDWLVSQKTKNTPAPATDAPRNERGLIPHGAIHGWMLTQAGRLRQLGLDADGIEPALLALVHANCEPPIDESKVSQMAKSVCNFPAGSVGVALTMPTPAAPPTSGVQIKRMSTYAGKKLYWLWQNRIPFGTLSTIAGDPDEGKSLITLYITARVSKGEKLYDNPLETEPAEVLILSAEDDPETTLRPRLEAAGADLDKVHLLESVMLRDGEARRLSERIAQLDEDIAAISSYLDQNPAIKLIVIDPISSFLGKANMNREQEVRRALQPIANRAKQTGLAVIMVAHFNKNSDTRSAMDRVGGAKAIVGMGRAAWTCVREPDKEPEPGVMPMVNDRRLLLKLKGNLAPSKIGGLVYTIRTVPVSVEDKDGLMVEVDQPYIVWVETTQQTAQDVVIGDRDGVPKVSKAKQAEVMLHEYLMKEGGWASVDNVKLHLPFEGNTLQRARANLKLWQTWAYVEGRPTSVWGLPGVKKPPSSSVQVEAEVVGTGKPRKRRGRVDLSVGAPEVQPASLEGLASSPTPPQAVLVGNMGSVDVKEPMEAF